MRFKASFHVSNKYKRYLFRKESLTLIFIRFQLLLILILSLGSIITASNHESFSYSHTKFLRYSRSAIKHECHIPTSLHFLYTSFSLLNVFFTKTKLVIYYHKHRLRRLCAKGGLLEFGAHLPTSRAASDSTSLFTPPDSENTMCKYLIKAAEDILWGIIKTT